VDERWLHDIFGHSSREALDEELFSLRVADGVPSLSGQLFELRDVLVNFRPFHVQSLELQFGPFFSLSVLELVCKLVQEGHPHGWDVICCIEGVKEVAEVSSPTGDKGAFYQGEGEGYALKVGVHSSYVVIEADVGF
jgi:hypothetical protein